MLQNCTSFIHDINLFMSLFVYEFICNVRYNLKQEHQKKYNVSLIFISYFLTRSLRESGRPCTKSMEDSESRMERVNRKVLNSGYTSNVDENYYHQFLLSVYLISVSSEKSGSLSVFSSESN